MTAPLDLVSAHPWQRVAFTTYALSLSFFEAVILDALIRGGGRQALILADANGVRASLSEQGAHRVGKDYEVEPVTVSNGVFHPKISVLSVPDDCHVLVGSGNLTFGGWGGNCEVLEHLHPSFAADAIADLAGFFEGLSTATRARHCVGASCAAIAADLRRSVQGRPHNGDIRLLHNLDRSMTEQITQVADDLGGAVGMIVASPFWDDGRAIDALCASLGLDKVLVHAHPHGTVEGTAGSNWPGSCRTSIEAVRLDLLDEQGPRRLHAKVFEILCKRGRLLISGSTNATTAALGSDGNVEVCVARIQRERTAGWAYSPSEPPDRNEPLDEDTDSEEENTGVLRAALEADELSGTVLTPRMQGRAEVYHLTPLGPDLIGEADLGPEGSFRISAPKLEEQSWLGSRLVIRVSASNGRHAEGFVSVASFADITRRAGLMGRRLFALLSGNETPADVAAIISWFYEDPRRLGQSGPGRTGGGSEDDTGDDTEEFIAVAELDHIYTEAHSAATGRSGAAHRNWSRFIEQIFSAFRQRRGPFPRAAAGQTGDDEDDAPDALPETAEDDPAIERSLAAFEKLFDLLLRPENASQHAALAFDLTQYVCERLQPEIPQVKEWLERLIRVWLDVGPAPERRSDIAMAVLALLAMTPEPATYRWARGCLLRLDIDLCAPMPGTDGARGFQTILPQNATFTDLWPELQKVRTFAEQVRAYLSALRDGAPSSGYPDLPAAAREEWPVLESALTAEPPRKKLLQTSAFREYCPHCNIMLPRGEVYKLKTTGIATAKSCCSRIIIWTGG